VINYTNNNQLMITRALSPAKITNMTIDEEKKAVEVYMDPLEVSKAIGRGGFNIRLAGQLTGYEIDVYREGAEEDVELTEFSDEIERLDWIRPRVFWSKRSRIWSNERTWKRKPLSKSATY
jgi:N utilization substance protein A